MCGSQIENIPITKKVKKSTYINIWGATSASGLLDLHIIPRGQTVNAEYYVNYILEKEVKPILKRTNVTEKPTTNRMVRNKQ